MCTFLNTLFQLFIKTNFIQLKESLQIKRYIFEQVEKFGHSPSGAALKSGSVAKHQKEVGLLLKAIDLVKISIYLLKKYLFLYEKIIELLFHHFIHYRRITY